jgi:hypothetical protein
MTPINFVRYPTVIGLLLLAGCSHRTPDITVEVIDTSLSITPRAERAALDAVQNQIGHMQRGDRLILIPITGDAQNDVGGRILRLSAPTQREAYDTDLRRFQAAAHQQFSAWVASLDKHQSRTDILGALDAARQELDLLPKESNRKFIVVTDFLEDDGTYNFVSNGSLANSARARELAASLRETHGFKLQGVSLCLGRLESSDIAALSTQRKEAVRAFWTAYFAASSSPAEIRFDGTGILADADRGCGNGSAHAITN